MDRDLRMTDAVAASDAARVLGNPNATSAERSAAASALAQTAHQARQTRALAAGTVAHSASMNSYFSVTDAPSRSTLLLFQECIFHLEIANAAFQFPDSLVVRHIGRQRPAREFLPVCLNPEPERDLAQGDLDRWLTDGTSTRRAVGYFLQWAHGRGLAGDLNVPLPSPGT
jgi:hypothetical protein